jgi:hypothetical protein
MMVSKSTPQSLIVRKNIPTPAIIGMISKSQGVFRYFYGNFTTINFQFGICENLKIPPINRRDTINKVQENP